MCKSTFKKNIETLYNNHKLNKLTSDFFSKIKSEINTLKESRTNIESLFPMTLYISGSYFNFIYTNGILKISYVSLRDTMDYYFKVQ